MSATLTEKASATQEQQLLKLQHEVESLRTQLRDAQRLATVGTMAAMVAHEFNNILTPIVNYAQLAQKRPALTDKALARAADGSQRATRICGALLGMVRGQDCVPESFSLSDLLSDTLAAMARDPKRDAIDLQTDIPRNLGVCAPRVELQQVLLNLLLNARAAVLDKSGPRQIRVSAKAGRKRVDITVSDNGVGIARENLDRIFEPFFTTKASDQQSDRGSGLGLAVCREILTSIGGHIDAQSIEGEGCTFRVRLPIIPPQARE